VLVGAAILDGALVSALVGVGGRIRGGRGIRLEARSAE